MNKNDILNKTFSTLNNDLLWIKSHTMFLTIHGSIAYGLNTPESDVDVRGICTVPKEYLLGFNKNFNEYIKSDPDCTIFNIKKFFHLAAGGNPNCLELLFTEPEDHILVTDLGKILIDNKDYFLSKQLKERYIGYSKAQAHRIRNHRKWILNPITKKPTRKEFGLSEKLLIDKNQFDIIKNAINKKLDSWNPDFEPFSESQKIYLQNKVSDILAEINITYDDKWVAASRTLGLDENFIAILKKEKEFENKLADYNNYCEWKQNRNPKRAAYEEKYLYDLKHATQLVRLLKLGKEILETGKLQVKRTHDREELMAIKTGSMTYEQLIEYADKIEEDVKIAYNNSKLPNQPNIKYLDNLCSELVERSLKI
jgi:predicted nucleotidyltransferase